VTSYDYDAPLDEAGHPTAKFFAYRDLILKHTGQATLPVPAVAPVVAVPEFALTPVAALWDRLPKPVMSEQPLTMEQVDQAYGYILYRMQLPAAVHGEVLKLDHLYDFGIVYVDGKQVGTLDRHYHQDSLTLDADGPARLDILVENTGRLNSTKGMRDERKGMRGAMLGDKPLTGWQIYSLPMEESELASQRVGKSAKTDVMRGPHFSTGSFVLKSAGDTFLDVSSLGKGLIWINGHALGRFWNVGPQGTLYVPGPWLKAGKNDVVVFELFDAAKTPMLTGLVRPMLDGPTPGYESDPERKKKTAADAEFGPKVAAPADVPPTQPSVPKAPKE